VFGHPLGNRSVEVSGFHRQADGVFLRERLDPERRRVGQPAGPVRTLLEEAPSSDAHDHDREATSFLHELLDQIEEQRVGSLEVFEDEHHRAFRRHPGEERQQPGPDLREVGAVLLTSHLAEPQG
jgi:hypothetical protein